MKKFNPKSPDSFLEKGADMSLAKFGHLNAIVNGINKTNTISSLEATATLTEEQSTSVILLDRAAGITVTLPSAKVGLKYTFIVSTNLSSATYKIITASSTQDFIGTVLVGVEATTPGANPGPKLFSGDGSTHVAINMNGGTTGGIKGTKITVKIKVRTNG